jgi:hypothetical protein
MSCMRPNSRKPLFSSRDGEGVKKLKLMNNSCFSESQRNVIEIWKSTPNFLEAPPNSSSKDTENEKKIQEQTW